MKICTRCETEKPDDAFAKHKRMCRECRNELNREREASPEAKARKASYFQTWKERDPEHARRVYFNNWLKKAYGITLDEYERLLDEQDGLCALCGLPPTNEDTLAPFEVDHCHETGAVRGLLHTNCNTGLGRFGDDVEMLRKAIAYLERALVERTLTGARP